VRRLSSNTAVRPQATSDSSALRPSSPAEQVIHRSAHLQSQRDQTLLGTVVQVTLDAAASVVGGSHDPWIKFCRNESKISSPISAATHNSDRGSCGVGGSK
jgi:hypothetical protein